MEGLILAGIFLALIAWAILRLVANASTAQTGKRAAGTGDGWTPLGGGDNNCDAGSGGDGGGGGD